MLGYTEEEIGYFWLNGFTRHNVRLFSALCRLNGGSPLAVLNAAREGHVEPPREKDEALCKTLVRQVKKAESLEFFEELDRRNLKAVTLVSDGYPELLKSIYDPPTVLYYRGHLPERGMLPIAVIGSRKSTAYGREVAKSFSKAFSEAGCTVVSGMAYGIDTSAAEGALSCEESLCPTVAVLGCGADVIYPAQNATLYERIVERGAVISEFAPGEKANRGYFPLRNRIISGMSLGVLVAEAGEKSGTSITVGCALEQGRETFAVPGRITDPMSMGANRMIRDGHAAPVLSPEDVLFSFGLTGFKEQPRPQIDFSALSEEEKTVLSELKNGEQSFDELCDHTGFPAAVLNCALTSLEFSGIMKQLPGRVYSLLPGIV